MKRPFLSAFTVSAKLQMRLSVAPVVATLIVSANSLFAQHGVSGGSKQPIGAYGSSTAQWIDRINAKPTPDLSTLFYRCVNSRNTPDSPLYDILKFRESPDTSAVPVLAQILDEFRHTTWIYGDAASQALFAIDTLEAHAALRESLITRFAEPRDPAFIKPYYSQGKRFDFAGAWGNREPFRSDFIHRYVLTNLSTNLAISVDYKRLPERPQRPVEYGGYEDAVLLEFQLEFKNTSKEAFVLSDGIGMFRHSLLFIQQSYGVYAHRGSAEPALRSSNPAVVRAGSSHTYKIRGVLRRSSARFDAGCEKPFVLDFVGAKFYLDSGEHSLIAMCEVFPRNRGSHDTEAGQANEETDFRHWWLGRAVSKPIPLTVPFRDDLDRSG